MTSEQRRVVLTLGFCGLVSAADNWFVSPALPAIAQTLAVAPSVVAVILTAYLVPYGALQPVCGAIGDRVGRVRLLRVIVAGLAVGTLVCALAPSLPALVAARILTGCFAAGIISVSQALVGDVVLAEDRAAAVGLLMGVTFTGQGALRRSGRHHHRARWLAGGLCVLWRPGRSCMAGRHAAARRERARGG